MSMNERDPIDRLVNGEFASPEDIQTLDMLTMSLLEGVSEETARYYSIPAGEYAIEFFLSDMTEPGGTEPETWMMVHVGEPEARYSMLNICFAKEGFANASVTLNDWIPAIHEIIATAKDDPFLSDVEHRALSYFELVTSSIESDPENEIEIPQLDGLFNDLDLFIRANDEIQIIKDKRYCILVDGTDTGRMLEISSLDKVPAVGHMMMDYDSLELILNIPGGYSYNYKVSTDSTRTLEIVSSEHDYDYSPMDDQRDNVVETEVRRLKEKAQYRPRANDVAVLIEALISATIVEDPLNILK